MSVVTAQLPLVFILSLHLHCGSVCSAVLSLAACPRLLALAVIKQAVLLPCCCSWRLMLLLQVDDVVMVMDESLRPAACGVAARLRSSGRRVDVILEAKKMKRAFKQAERSGAARLLLVGGEEWQRGAVAVKDLASRQQTEVLVDQLA
eukprot:GHRQ01023758.1.p2 GENE.GHRQ01023758.1~~GHRQ01023758.1.p2  ORF type:complete len:148 (-),score=23.49 GHRQ01023758.1:391-834(-)